MFVKRLGHSQKRLTNISAATGVKEVQGCIRLNVEYVFRLAIRIQVKYYILLLYRFITISDL